jgi:4-hydroxy-tetrahydrodipicolinate synthase
MDTLRTSWNGVFVPVVTPFDSNGDFDEVACRQLLDLLIDDGVHGIIVAGSTGEWFTLNNTERARLFEVALDQVNKRVTLLGGVAAIATRDSISLAKIAKELGLDGALLLPPPYALPTERELLCFFEDVAKVGLPIMVYNNPGRTQVNLDARLMGKICEFDSIVALKDSSKDLYQMSDTIRTLSGRIAVFCGLEPYALPCLQRGAVGIVAMSPNILGKRSVNLYEYTVSGRWSDAFQVEHLIDRLYAAFYTPGHSAYVVIKECMNIVGRPAGFPRLPLLPIEEAGRKKIRSLLEDMGVL